MVKRENMPQIVLCIGMLLTLHSFGLIIASLLTNKWYTDNKKDIGIYGICEHSSSFNETYFYRNKYSYNKANINKTLQQEGEAAQLNHNGKIKKRRNNIFLIVDNSSNATAENTSRVKKSTNNTKCFQLIWPDSQQAFQYLTGNNF